jgi:hypothetical protein
LFRNNLHIKTFYKILLRLQKKCFEKHFVNAAATCRRLIVIITNGRNLFRIRFSTNEIEENMIYVR